MKSAVLAGCYEIERELGSGAGGTTYLVRDREEGHQLKVLKRLLGAKATPTLVKAFKSECALLKKLSHPHLARLLDYSNDGKELYYTSEYVEGEDFVSACQKKDWNAVFQLIVQACWALDYLHTNKIIHRDLKPDNMLVGMVHDADASQTLERLRLKIIDFGLAVAAKNKDQVKETAGTLAYMAPEVLAQQDYDQRADLYSFGVVLYEMALGRLPVKRGQSFAMYLEALRQQDIDLTPLRASDEVPVGIIKIIERLVEKDPKRRLAKARAIIELLNAEERENFALSAEKAVSSVSKTRAPKKQRVRSRAQGKQSAQEVVDELLALVRSGDRHEAQRFAESQLSRFKTETEQGVVEAFYAAMGHVLIEQGRYPEAHAFLAEMAAHPALGGERSFEHVILAVQLAYREGALDTATQNIESVPANEIEQATLVQRTRFENYRALVLQALSKPVEAAASFEKAAAYAAESERQDHQLSLLINAATLQQEQGRWDRAYELFIQALELARALDNPSSLASILSNLGNLYFYFGRLSQAEEALEESLALSQEHGLQSLIAYNLFLLTVGEQGKGNEERVAKYIEQALTFAKDLGESQAMFQAQLAKGYRALELKDLNTCEEVLGILRDYVTSTGQESYELQANWFEAKFRIAQEKYADYPVAAWLAALKKDALERQAKNNLWQILSDEGELAQLSGKTLAAKRSYNKALQVIDELKASVPESFQQSFMRDRKKEKIRQALAALGPAEKKENVSQSMDATSFIESSDINRRLLMMHDVDQLLEEVLDAAIHLTDAERGFVILSDRQDLDIRAARNFDSQDLDRDEEEISRTIAKEVMRTGKTIVSLDAQTDERFAESQSVHALEIRSVLCTPLLTGRRTVGLIYLDNRFRPGVLKSEHLQMIESLADQASLILEHTRLHRDNERKIEELERSKVTIESLNARLEQDLHESLQHLEAARESMKREHEELRLKYSYDNIIGKSPALKKVLVTLDRVTQTHSPVFIHGESGSGKELIAQALHYNGPRNFAPFITENCAALAETLLESELFGHVKGAFTGADNNKIGLFQMAHRGTLFLDEVGDMSLGMQAKLLRVLQEGEVRRVGGRDYQKVDVRIITASHRDIKAMVARQEFRKDLYYRLNVVQINVPPLRERGEDILLLAEHFLEQAAQEAGKRKLRLSKGAIRALMDYPWPGNIRELQNEMHRLMVLGADVVGPSLLSPHILEAAQQERSFSHLGSLEAAIAPIEKRLIMAALDRCHGNKMKAAELLQVARRTIYLKIKQYKIDPNYGKGKRVEKA